MVKEGVKILWEVVGGPEEVEGRREGGWKMSKEGREGRRVEVEFVTFLETLSSPSLHLWLL